MTVVRIITAQGPTQLINVLSILQFQESKENDGIGTFKDYLVVMGLYADESASEQMKEVCFLLGSIWNFEKYIYLQQQKWDSLCYKNFELAKNTLRDYLEINTADIVYVCRNWQPCNELILSTYQGADRICYGDGWGVLDSNREDIRYVNPQGMLKVERAYSIFPKHDHEKYKDIKSTIVPSKFLKQTLTKIVEQKSLIRKIFEDTFININNQNHKRIVLITTSNFTESKTTLTLQDEIECYLSCILMYVSKKDFIIIKGHPRQTNHQSTIVADKFKENGYQVLEITGLANSFSIEVFFPLIPKIDLGITLGSNTAKSLAFFYQCDLIIGLSEDQINKYINPTVKQEMLKSNNNQYLYCNIHYPFPNNTFDIATMKTQNIMILNSFFDNLIVKINSEDNLETIKFLEKNDDYLKHYPSLLYAKAIALAKQKLYHEAIETLDILLSNMPHHYKAKKLLQEVESFIDEETKTLRRKIKTMMTESKSLLNQGKQVEALRLSEKSAKEGLFVAGMHCLRAVCDNAVGRHEEALEAAQEELTYNPYNIEAQNIVAHLTKALAKPEKPKIPTLERPYKTSLPHDLLMSIQNSLHNYSYKDIPLLKNPFDFAIYPVLLWKVKPRTIIEIGSKSGGSAVWFGDLLTNFGIDGHIYSVDIVKVEKHSHPNVTFLEGDGQNLPATFNPDFLQKLPRPLLVIEDADHSYKTSKSVLEFFHPYLQENEYIVIEDGIISDIAQDKSYNSGPHQALKEFLSKYSDEYEIDAEYCDFFAYNLTWCTNGFLRKKPRKIEKKLLNLGCGSHFNPNWTNVDFTSTGEGVIAHNLRQGIPFPDRTFEVVYHSHILEHFPKSEAESFLKECYRVLESQGIIRVVIPDLEKIARLYLQSLNNALQGSEEANNNYDWIMLEMYDQVVRNESGGEMKKYLAQNPLPNEQFIIERLGVEGEQMINQLRGKNFPNSALNPTQIGYFRESGEIHQWMYDRFSLSRLLAKVGFVDIKICQANESCIPNFNSYYLDVLPDGRVRKSDSLFMEGMKPEN
ncbi:CmcI family methyltransferase [Geminocystis sp. CENA526]|uniref:CmcI family methyltransferase n=1 Tax=Geminocystis sp. CENA526 TaxID=1355871 RepID=UPI003D6F576C